METLLNIIERMQERVTRGKKVSNSTYFYELLYFGEMIVKINTLGMLAAINEDRDDYTYRALHKLVRTSGIGDWVQVFNGTVFGPAAAYIIDEAQAERKQFLEMKTEEWHSNSIRKLHNILTILLPDSVQSSEGASWFELFVRLRNKTRGHGAPTPDIIDKVIDDLEYSVNEIADNLLILKRQWAFLKRNQSGKYKVSDISEDANSFNYLKISSDYEFLDGVYIYFGTPRLVKLIITDSDLTDYYIANGSFTETKFELLSYISGSVIKGDSTPYNKPITPLPGSETDGLIELDLQRNCFTNIPDIPMGYVTRKIEDEIYPLLINDRHPIVTLKGRGGIGKTSAALKVINEITKTDRYQAIVWFSARDVDLKENGAKQVNPQVLNIKEIANAYWSLINDNVAAEKAPIKIERFLKELSKAELGATLFVFDNFETVSNQGELFTTLDNYVRNPNKILITTRHHKFRADYPIEVKGMLEEEFSELVYNTTIQLKMNALEPRELDEMYRKSEGHPYVVKIVLGEMSKPGGRKPLEHIIASRDDILDVLFERTYTLLTTGAKRVFLTLCTWSSVIPELAVEAVMLRNQTDSDRFEPQEAIDELTRISFIERSYSETDDEAFLNVPIAAAIFGKKKLTVDQMKALIEADSKFLQLFGAGQNTDIKHGLQPKINRLFANLRKTLVSNPERLQDIIPVLEFIARKHSFAWIKIASLIEEFGGEDKLPLIKEKLQKYLETADQGIEKAEIWNRVAEINEKLGDIQGMIHALIEKCEAFPGAFNDISGVAAKFNGMLQRKVLEVDSEAKRVLAAKLAKLMDERISEANATDMSRLAWLCLHMHDEDKAATYTVLGLQLEPDNEYCLSLRTRLQLN